MKIYYNSSLPKFDNEETVLYYSSRGMIVIKSKSHIARVNEIFTIDETTINEYATSRGFEKVLETTDDGSKTIWEEKYDTDEWKDKIRSISANTRSELCRKTVHRIVVDQTVNKFISELGSIEYK